MSDKEKLQTLCGKTYKEQAIWFLNAFWKQYGAKEAEGLWQKVIEMAELDTGKKAEGNALDEMMAHRFLEKHHETMTVQSMREKLRQSQALGPAERPKLVPLTHYLIIHYNVDWKVLVNAQQGNKEEIDKASALLEEVNELFRQAAARAEEAAEALRLSKAAEAEALHREAEATSTAQQAAEAAAEAQSTEAEAIQKESEALEAERPFKEAQDELNAAIANMKAQEEAYKNKTNELKAKSETGGAVQKNKAKAELEIHLKEDPLPLRKAKITTEAAERKADKLRAPFKAAREAAETARAAAEAARIEAERTKAAADAAAEEASRAREAAQEAAAESERAAEAAEQAVEDARNKVAEAEAYLEEAKKKNPEGSIWWLSRELAEAKKFMPKSKGGVAKK